MPKPRLSKPSTRKHVNSHASANSLAQAVQRQSGDIVRLADLCAELMTEIAETNLKLLFVMNQFGVTIKPRPGAIEIPGTALGQPVKMNLVQYFALKRETFIEKLREEAESRPPDPDQDAVIQGSEPDPGPDPRD